MVVKLHHMLRMIMSMGKIEVIAPKILITLERTMDTDRTTNIIQDLNMVTDHGMRAINH